MINRLMVFIWWLAPRMSVAICYVSTLNFSLVGTPVFSVAGRIYP